MSESLSATISVVTSAFLQSNQAFSTQGQIRPVLDFEFALNSTDITKCYFNAFTVTTSVTNIDVTNLTDAFGNALNYSNVLQVHVINTSTGQHLNVGGGTNALFGPLPQLLGQTSAAGTVGSCVSLTTPMTVSPTSKIIALQAASGTVTANVIILGN